MDFPNLGRDKERCVERSLLNAALLSISICGLRMGWRRGSPATHLAGTARAVPGSKEMAWKQKVLLSGDKPRTLQKD